MNWFVVLALVLAASSSLLDAAPAKKNRRLTARNDLLRMFERELLLGKLKNGASQSEDEPKRELTGLKRESDNGISSSEESDSSGSGGSGSGEIFVPSRPEGGRRPSYRKGGNRKPSRPGKGARRSSRPKGGNRKSSKRSEVRSAKRNLAMVIAHRQISKN